MRVSLWCRTFKQTRTPKIKATMLDEQMYILWQLIKYLASIYTNINKHHIEGHSFACLFTFILWQIIPYLNKMQQQLWKDKSILIHNEYKYLNSCMGVLLQDQLFMCWPQFARRECGSSADLRPAPAGTSPWPDSGTQPAGAYTGQHRCVKQLNTMMLDHAKNRAFIWLK